MSAVDWGEGHYESTAAQLLPAAEVLVEAAAPREGEVVVDVGCGTGNAALLAAERGAAVVGVDPAARLLEVARKDAEARGLSARFELGDAASLPLGEAEANLVMSVFAVIFAPDPSAAAVEMARVTGPDGRIVLSAWIPGGAVSQVNRISREAVLEALGAPPPPPPFAWHEQGALSELFGPHGFEVSLREHTISFTGESPRAYLEAESLNHPMAIAGRAVLEARGQDQEVLGRMLEVLEAENEDPAAFKVTSSYVVAIAARG